jgi:glycerophosphoryl diester phosphodiesterase
VSLQGRLLGAPIAHRGLWRAPARPENSLAAFEAASAAGYGIELDVRLTADGEAVVFHDETLDRMTFQSGLVEEYPVDELTRLTLLGSDQSIPTLEQALTVIGTRALVLIELKTPPGQEGPLEARVAELLAAHPGPAGVLSFNAGALAWMADHAPGLARGLNADTATAFETMDRARPYFLSVSVDLAAHPRLQDWRNNGRAAICWTVRKAADWDRYAALADNLVFEGFIP